MRSGLRGLQRVEVLQLEAEGGQRQLARLCCRERVGVISVRCGVGVGACGAQGVPLARRQRLAAQQAQHLARGQRRARARAALREQHKAAAVSDARARCETKTLVLKTMCCSCLSVQRRAVILRRDDERLDVRVHWHILRQRAAQRLAWHPFSR